MTSEKYFANRIIIAVVTRVFAIELIMKSK